MSNETAHEFRSNRGDFQSEAVALDEIVRRLVDQLKPTAIWLFGSRAKNTNRPDSDFDLLVVMPKSEGNAGSDYDRAYAPIAGLGVGADIIPVTEDDFEQERFAQTGLIPEILKTGRQIYVRPALEGKGCLLGQDFGKSGKVRDGHTQ